MSKLRFIHFVIDDKFINDSIKCFEESNLTINYFYIVTNGVSEFQFIKSCKVQKVSKEEALGIICADNSYDVLCLHSLISLPYDLIVKIPSYIKVIWYAWGFDLYSNPKPIGPLLNIGERYMNQTKQIIPKESFNFFVKKRLKNILSKINGTYISKDIICSAIRRIDYFSGVFPIEYDMLLEQCPYFRAKKIVHNYIHPNEFKLEDMNQPLDLNGHNILLGNSATYYINHVDLLDKIKNQVGSTTLVITPLSYQGSPQYIRKVIKFGVKCFGDNFKPLISYLTFDEYTKVMKSCDTLILGQKQQAATCNCLTSLWNGLKLYLPSDSMNYKFYKSLGLKVFSLDEFDNSLQLSYEDVIQNRVIIEKFYSYRAWKKDLEDSIKILTS